MVRAGGTAARGLIRVLELPPTTTVICGSESDERCLADAILCSSIVYKILILI